MATPGLPTRWRLAPGVDLSWRDWGEDSVVYEAGSGATHRFAPLPAAVMACFEAAPCTFDELAAQLADDLACEVDDDLRAALQESVDEFLKLGWIEPIPSA